MVRCPHCKKYFNIIESRVEQAKANLIYASIGFLVSKKVEEIIEKEIANMKQKNTSERLNK